MLNQAVTANRVSANVRDFDTRHTAGTPTMESQAESQQARNELDRAYLLERERVEAMEGRQPDPVESDWCKRCGCGYRNCYCE